MYPFLTPSKTDGRVPSQQGAPTTYNLTYWEVLQKTYICPKHYWPVWVWPKGKIQTFSWGVRWRGGRFLTNITGQFGCGLRAKFRPLVEGWGGGGEGFWHITHSSYYRHQILFLSHLQASKICLKNRYFEEKIHWISPEVRARMVRLEGDWNGLQLCLTLFQSSFLLFVKFDITLGKH